MISKQRYRSEPKFVPSDVESREYLSKVNSIGTKLGELTGRLDELNKEVVNRISNGNAPVDRGSMDLSKALKVSFITYYSALDRDGTDAFIPEYRTDNQVLFASLLSTNAALIGDLNKKFEEILEISKSAAEFRTKVRGDYSKKLAEWQSATQKDRNELNEFRDGLKLVKEQERKQRFGLASTPQEEKNVSIPFLIQTNVTRFGPMLIILFFVNILVNLYRYSIRLAAYYDARGDSLELLDIKIHADAFQKLAASVSPDALDISKPPKLPTEYAVDIAKAAVGKIGASHKE